MNLIATGKTQTREPANSLRRDATLTRDETNHPKPHEQLAIHSPQPRDSGPKDRPPFREKLFRYIFAIDPPRAN